MPKLTRITRDARVMGGKPCIRGMRVTVGTVVGLVAAGHTTEEILRQYPYLEAADVAEAAARAPDRGDDQRTSKRSRGRRRPTEGRHREDAFFLGGAASQPRGTA